MAEDFPKCPTTVLDEEAKQKAKAKSLKRREARKRRIARKRQAKIMTETDKRIGEVKVQMCELVEAEKQKSERFLSLARKYYSMWKELNEEVQQKSVWKSQSSQTKDFKPNIAVLKEQNFTFPIAMTSVTMDKRFSDSTASGPFKIVGETLNISSGMSTTDCSSDQVKDNLV